MNVSCFAIVMQQQGLLDSESMIRWGDSLPTSNLIQGLEIDDFVILFNCLKKDVKDISSDVADVAAAAKADRAYALANLKKPDDKLQFVREVFVAWGYGS